MAGNEEYLDSLLKSMSNTDKKTADNDNAIMTPEEIEAMFAVVDRIASDEAATEPEDEPEEYTVEPEDEPEEYAVEPGDEPEEYTVDNTRNMSEEEIENLINASEQYAKEDAVDEKETDAEEISLEDMDNDDLLALLGSLDAKSDLDNIENFIEEQNEEAVSHPAQENDIEADAVMQDTETAKERRERIKKEKQEEKKAKREEKQAAKEEKRAAKEERKAAKAEKKAAKETEETAEEKATNEEKKKGGKVSKLFSFLTEEEEEPASDENKSILDELEAEDLAESRKKKKVKKGKMPQKDGQDDAKEEEIKKDGKAKAKKKKPPKPKKQKAPKAVAAKEPQPSRRISTKSIAVIIAFAATLFLIVFVASTYFSARLQIDRAKKAFRKMDYATCYAELYGMELSDEEKEMFKHAELVLKMQRRMEVYEMYMAENKELEALDSLFQAVAQYEDTYTQALEYGAGPEVSALYDKILAILRDNYGVSQDEVHSIAACDTNVEYTRYLTALMEGGMENSGVAVPEEEMQDILPAEEELVKPEFAD